MSRFQRQNALVRRYESNRSAYFEEEELLSIVDFYLSQQKTDQAFQAVEHGLELYPDSYNLQEQKICTLMRSGRYAEAVEAANQLRVLSVKEADPNDIDSMQDEANAILLQGETLLLIKREKEAEQTFRQLLHPRYGQLDDAYLDIATVYFDHDAYDAAIQFLKEGLRYFPTNEPMLSNLACAMTEACYYKEAVDAYNKALQANPYSAANWLALGEIQMVQLNNPEEAVRAYEYAYLLNEQDTNTEYKLALAYTTNKQLLEAIHHLEQLINKPSEIPLLNLYFQAAYSYDLLKDSSKALNYYQKAYAINQHQLFVNTGLCLNYFRENRINPGLKILNQLIEEYTNSGEVCDLAAEIYDFINTRSALMQESVMPLFLEACKANDLFYLNLVAAYPNFRATNKL